MPNTKGLRRWMGPDPLRASHKSEYDTWVAMRQRCQNPNNSQYHHYGGRGISICARWSFFENFLADMGPRPAKLSLDRIDNNGNYTPENCRWADGKTQILNSRHANMITHNGQTLCLKDWAAILGINHQTLRNRFKRGWTKDEALSTTRVSVGRDALGHITGRITSVSSSET